MTSPEGARPGSRSSERTERSVTITDIARAAGVSIGTVSHYLNATAKVASPTAEAIRAAMDELNYQPNLNARSLRARTTHTLGLVLPNITNPFYTEVAALIGDQAAQHGYQLILCSSGEDERVEALHLQNLHQRRVDGALVVSTGKRTTPQPGARLPFPRVFVDRRVAGQPSVTTDNELGGRLALEHLVTLGHRRIGFIVGDEHVENIQQRLAGARHVLAEHGLDTAQEHVIRGTQSIETGQEAERFWRSDHPPTAIFTTNDVIALGVWRTCLAAGVRLPQDVSLIGFDNIGWSRLTVPPLTTVAQDVATMTRRALELVIDAIAGTPLHDTTELITPSVVVRESTRKIDPGKPANAPRSPGGDVTASRGRPTA